MYTQVALYRVAVNVIIYFMMLFSGNFVAKNHNVAATYPCKIKYNINSIAKITVTRIFEEVQ